MARANIFLTDDDEDDRLLIRSAIEGVMDDVNIIESASGEELLKSLAERGGDVPSAILMDMNMPKMTGLETLARIRALLMLSHIPVIMISTTTNRQIIRHSFQLGVNAFLKKPVLENDFRRLAEAMRVNLTFGQDSCQAIFSDKSRDCFNIALIGHDTCSTSERLQSAEVREVVPGAPEETVRQLNQLKWNVGQNPDLILLIPGEEQWQADPDTLTDFVMAIEHSQSQYTPIMLLGNVMAQSVYNPDPSTPIPRSASFNKGQNYRWLPGGLS